MSFIMQGNKELIGVRLFASELSVQTQNFASVQLANAKLCNIGYCQLTLASEMSLTLFTTDNSKCNIRPLAL